MTIVVSFLALEKFFRFFLDIIVLNKYVVSVENYADYSQFSVKLSEQVTKQRRSYKQETHNTW